MIAHIYIKTKNIRFCINDNFYEIEVNVLAFNTEEQYWVHVA